LHISKATILSTLKNLNIATLLIFSCATAWATDFDKGLAAAKAGDYSTAFSEWKPLAEQGDGDAQNNLALMHANGQGVIPDNVYAHMWSNIGAANGNENARNNKDILVKDVTPQEISKAQDRARECVKKNYKDCLLYEERYYNVAFYADEYISVKSGISGL
jgi:hypothetical protein